MSKNKVLLKAGLAYTASNVVIRGISFLSVPIFIRLLTVDEFGKYNFFVSIEGFLIVFSALAIHASIKNAYYDKKERFDAFVQNCVYVDIVNSLLIALIGNFICYFFSEAIDLNFIEVNLLVLSGFSQALITIYTAKLIMDYKSTDFVVVSFITVIIGILLSLLFIYTIFDYNHYYGRIWGSVLGQAAAAIYILYRLFGDKISNINFTDWKYGLQISLPIVPHGVSQFILSSANRVMIIYMYNAFQAGIFSLTYTLSLIPQVLFSSVSNVWEPWFFENMHKKNFHSIKEASSLFCTFISAFFIMMACAVPEIVKIIATEEYYESMDISIIVLMGCYFATLFYIPSEVEYYYKKTTYIAVSTVSCAVLNVVLNLLLMPHYPYKVAAYVTLISYLMYFIFHLLMSRIICGKWLFNMLSMATNILVTISLMVASIFLIDSLTMRLLLFSIIAVFTIYIVNNKMQIAKIIIKKNKVNSQTSLQNYGE